MRLGILGGTFDPPHVGHLVVAADAFEALALDRLVFVPAAVQPLKAGRATATAAQRLAMVRAMVDGDARFEVSAVEVERGGLSYTVDTLRHFAERFPDADRFLLLGSDVVPTLAQWREPREVVRLARPVVLQRDGAGAAAAAGAADGDLAGVTPMRLATRRIDVSSTEIRERVRLGKSIRGFVTDAVALVIARDGLYR